MAKKSTPTEPVKTDNPETRPPKNKALIIHIPMPYLVVVTGPEGNMLARQFSKSRPRAYNLAASLIQKYNLEEAVVEVMDWTVFEKQG